MIENIKTAARVAAASRFRYATWYGVTRRERRELEAKAYCEELAKRQPEIDRLEAKARRREEFNL